MLASCGYLPQELFECYTESCEIYPVDDEEVPTDIKSSDFQEHEFELDGWARWDMPSDDYYDTSNSPKIIRGMMAVKSGDSFIIESGSMKGRHWSTMNMMLIVGRLISIRR